MISKIKKNTSIAFFIINIVCRSFGNKLLNVNVLPVYIALELFLYEDAMLGIFLSDSSNAALTSFSSQDSFSHISLGKRLVEQYQKTNIQIIHRWLVFRLIQFLITGQNLKNQNLSVKKQQKFRLKPTIDPRRSKKPKTLQKKEQNINMAMFRQKNNDEVEFHFETHPQAKGIQLKDYKKKREQETIS